MAVSAYQERAARKYASRMLCFLFRRRRLAVKLPDACFPLMGGHGGASIYIDLHMKGASWVWLSLEWRQRWRRPGILVVHGLMRTDGKDFVYGGPQRPSLTRASAARTSLERAHVELGAGSGARWRQRSAMRAPQPGHAGGVISIDVGSSRARDTFQCETVTFQCT
jgi:hypothetical protein